MSNYTLDICLVSLESQNEDHLERDQWIFSVKGHMVNILEIVGHTLLYSAATVEQKQP